MIWLLALLALQYAMHAYAQGDPGDEHVDPPVHLDGWPHEGCTCTACVELRTRQVSQYALPDEESLLAGLHAYEWYAEQMQFDGDFSLIEDLSLYEQRGFTLMRIDCLKRAADSEARSQTMSWGQGGIL